MGGGCSLEAHFGRGPIVGRLRSACLPAAPGRYARLIGFRAGFPTLFDRKFHSTESRCNEKLRTIELV
jgi:hypothetical protein